MDTFEKQYLREKSLAQLAHERATGLFLDQARNGNGGASSAAAWIVGKYLPLTLRGLDILREADSSPTKLLKALDDLGYRLTCAIAIEGLLDALLAKPEETRTSCFSRIAERLNYESIIGSFTAANPLRAAQLHKRASREVAGQRKKARMFITSSEVTGDPIIQIEKTFGAQLAAILCGLLIGAGMIEEVVKQRGTKTHTYFKLSEECTSLIFEKTRQAGESFGMFSPMLHKPLDWAPGRVGGYLTPEMREVARLVLGPPSLSKKALHESSEEFFQALNGLQGTAWAVNREILQVVRTMAADGSLKEVVRDVGIKVPDYPEHLEGVAFEDRTAEQQEEHKLWVQAAREAHALIAKQTSASLRYVRILEDANNLKDAEEFFFVWSVDSRGRMYPRTYGMSPQGSDLQKALLRFAKPSKITTPFQLRLFRTNLAHRWGFDKASYEDTEKWVLENTQQILAHAKDPLNDRGWTKADSPFLYLAAAMEYARYLEDPASFESFIPIAMDGANNGSQHMAAIIRDPRTAHLTNLTPDPARQDLYMETGRATEGLIRAARASGELDQCLHPMEAFGIPRGLVKRPTMTLAYGLTQRSVAGYLYGDYLAGQEIPGLPENDKFKVAVKLTPYVWAALKDTQRATMDVLQWLRKAIMERQATPTCKVSWKTPDGFLAQQFAAEYEDSRVRTWCGSHISIRWSEQGIEPSPRRHKTAFPPNFIHSMDANHLREITRRMLTKGCTSFAMIHDDFGVPIGFADALWHTAREAFRDQYQTNIMDSLREQWNLALPALEMMGWDIDEVLQAQYAFK